MIKNLLIIFCLVFVGCNGVSQEKKKKEKIATPVKTEYKISKTDKEWRASLTEIQYFVLRKAGTETSGSSALLDNKKEGTYVCAACNTALFKSEHKFNSGTGWPSFDREITNNVAFDVDYKIGYERTEEHCATCGGHLGHVFNDGPKTTGKRHCINGAALKFIPNK